MTTLTFEEQLVEHRVYLLRFARLQLRNDAWAEDAVSETLLAALSKPQTFGNRSQLKTWLIGILKHKVVDQLRRHTREATILVGDDGEDLDEALFLADGHWRNAPHDWGDPDAAGSRRQFFEVLQVCCEQLPPVQARVSAVSRRSTASSSASGKVRRISKLPRAVDNRHSPAMRSPERSSVPA